MLCLRGLVYTFFPLPPFFVRDTIIPPLASPSSLRQVLEVFLFVPRQALKLCIYNKQGLAPPRVFHKDFPVTSFFRFPFIMTLSYSRSSQKKPFCEEKLVMIVLKLRYSHFPLPPPRIPPTPASNWHQLFHSSMGKLDG